MLDAVDGYRAFPKRAVVVGERRGRHLRTDWDVRILEESAPRQPHDTVAAGSGGGHRSNEVAVRALLPPERLRVVSFAVGHLHTPRVDGYDEGGDGNGEQTPDVVAATLAATPRIG